MMDPVLRVEELTKVFPPGRRPVRSIGDLGMKLLGKECGTPVLALRDVSFEVGRGEVFGLLGPNGAGKTTICRILNALVLPTSGHAWIGGYDVIEEHREVARLSFSVFSGETEMWGLFSNRLDVHTNLNFIGRVWRIPGGERRVLISEALRAVGLEGKEEEWYQKLSAGQKQRVWLAALLIVRPRFAILDEPTIKLDLEARHRFFDTIQDTIPETTYLLTTHNIHEAEAHCDRVAILKEGRLIALGSPSELKSHFKERKVTEIHLTSSRLEAVSKVLAQIEGLSSVYRCDIEQDAETGRCIVTITSGKEEEILDACLRHIMEVGRIQTIGSKTLSLEDVFLSATKGE